MVPRRLARADEGVRRLLVAEDISEDTGSYLCTVLGLSPAGDSFYLLPRKPGSDEIKFFGFPAENDAPYVVELIQTANVADVSGSWPLYAIVGVYAADRNRFECSQPTPPTEQVAVTSSRTG